MQLGRLETICWAGLMLFGPFGCRPAASLPPECLNGVMERRQFLGLDPFAPPCDGPDPGPLPIYPVLAAKASVDGLLANKEEFRNLIRLGLPTGALQLPPVINMGLFERIAELLQVSGQL